MECFPLVSGNRSDGGAAGGGNGLRLGNGEGGGGGVGAEDEDAPVGAEDADALAAGGLKWDQDPVMPGQISEPLKEYSPPPPSENEKCPEIPRW
eukprot:CAMPEP_0172723528 /NCGR_PEP_ID=MMETSP1074-20121228/83946_1 /TAXON_ID=2916 /ORGANISM="Ceratium fusus, Strain PA161109" /LENGTH=93 /DNA_ID=CAMNT_0013549787 /DNA_START=411 /DNA_END=689 /DNA_ORIENTATION=+